MISTDHLFLELADRKVKIREPLQITLRRGEVTLKNQTVTVTMVRDGHGVTAIVNGEPFLVEKYHVSYGTYPLIRTALKS